MGNKVAAMVRVAMVRVSTNHGRNTTYLSAKILMMESASCFE